MVNSDNEDNAPPSYTTSSTCSPIRIRPTVFTREKTTEQEDRLKAQSAKRMLEDIPDHLVREILKAPRIQHLLATQKQLERDNFLIFGQVADAEVEKIVERRMNRYLEEELKGAFKKLVQQRLDHLVEAQLPLAAQLFLDGADNGHRDRFYEDCKMNEAGLHEVADDGRTRLRATADKCSTELGDMAQEEIDRYKDQAEEANNLIGEHLEHLKYWSRDLARVAPRKGAESRTIMRCKSV